MGYTLKFKGIAKEPWTLVRMFVFEHNIDVNKKQFCIHYRTKKWVNILMLLEINILIVAEVDINVK